MEEYENAQMEQTELGRFHKFSVGVRVSARLMLFPLVGKMFHAVGIHVGTQPMLEMMKEI